jgi:hypothetical protein
MLTRITMKMSARPTYRNTHPAYSLARCSASCVGTAQNTNWGGQDDPNQIVNSNGYCISGACIS